MPSTEAGELLPSSLAPKAASTPKPQPTYPLWVRGCGFVAVAALEYFLANLVPHHWLIGKVVLSPVIVFVGALMAFGSLRAAPRLYIRSVPDRAHVRWPYLGLHLFALALFALSECTLLRTQAAPAVRGLMIAVWAASLLLMLGSLVAALLPGYVHLRLLRSLGSVWAYAALSAVAVTAAMALLQTSWDMTTSWPGRVLQGATFTGVKLLLGVFYRGIFLDPPASTIGTARFGIKIAGACSGIEGLALMLVLSVGWLLFARRELRMARAFLLVPAALLASWLLNIVRITLLIAIGDAGYPTIALHGFHSQAGWIFFNIAAIGFLLTAQHLRWLHQPTPAAAAPGNAPAAAAFASGRNVSVAYLLPFLAVLATSIVGRAVSSGAVSSDFDWLYPLRFFVALALLWRYRTEYRTLNWRFGWLGPLAGLAVFALWFGVDRWHSSAAPVLAAQLAQLLPWQRLAWIVTRSLAAVVTVPVIEELAFRGYIARRVLSDDVESVTFARLNLSAVLLSSIAFGLLHGRMWLPGIVAGITFALVARYRNRLGEAVAAHATANMLIAAWVLITGDYSMW